MYLNFILFLDPDVTHVNIRPRRTASAPNPSPIERDDQEGKHLNKYFNLTRYNLKRVFFFTTHVYVNS